MRNLLYIAGAVLLIVNISDVGAVRVKDSREIFFEKLKKCEPYKFELAQNHHSKMREKYMKEIRGIEDGKCVVFTTMKASLCQVCGYSIESLSGNVIYDDSSCSLKQCREVFPDWDVSWF